RGRRVAPGARHTRRTDIGDPRRAPHQAWPSVGLRTPRCPSRGRTGRPPFPRRARTWGMIPCPGPSSRSCPGWVPKAKHLHAMIP
ncbi:hypothetical protein S83_001674, partial [Arachis hypogaea]